MREANRAVRSRLLLAVVTGAVMLAARPAAASTIVISGVVQDTSGITVNGVKITLSGSSQATAITNIRGEYSFTVAPGSYSVSASGYCASFAPSVVNLNNLTTGATADFVGSGGACSPLTFSGATSGPFTISGQVTSAGHAVPGAKVTLSGSTTGFRYTDETGHYSFSVAAGSYAVKVTGGCASFTPDVANLNNLRASASQNFVGSGNCPIAPLALCPQLDQEFLGASEPASCNTVSTPDCAIDRVDSWDNLSVIDFATAVTNDCRFGTWSTGLLSSSDVTNYLNDLLAYTLYFFGCPATGTVTGPLSDGLIPAALQGHSFTTADLAALSQLYAAAVEQALADSGLPALSQAQQSAITAQLAAVAARVPNVVSSSSYTFSTCTH